MILGKLMQMSYTQSHPCDRNHQTLDEQDLSVRKAHAQTGFAAVDFFRIRNADLGRFIVDRLLTILNSLDAGVEVSVHVRHPRAVLKI
jgi:Helix-turn-helix domain